MAKPLQVGCVRKTDRMSPHERIEMIGGENPNGSAWSLPESHAIEGIKSGQWSFYVPRPPGERVNLVIATHLGREYLKTEVDGEQPDNLLALPECPRYQ